jgi:hypothetical protein
MTRWCAPTALAARTTWPRKLPTPVCQDSI